MSRKHRKQMTPSELEIVRASIDKLDMTTIWHFHEHVYKRVFQKKLSAVDIINCVKFGTVMEVHCKVKGDIRILLRQALKHGKSMCCVVSLKAEKVITAYYNDNKDNHYTIDWSEYRWTENLIPIVKGYMQKKVSKERTRSS